MLRVALYAVSVDFNAQPATRTLEQTMQAEIIATGDEIRTGTIVDSNSAHIAQELEESAFEVTRHCCVGDDIPVLASVLKEVGQRADIAVVTGGLGPTEDDLTAGAAAKALGVDLVLDENALASVTAFFKNRDRLFSKANRKQALLPVGAVCLPNPIGTAPGFRLKIGRCIFFFLPGVPREMRDMLANSVLPYLKRLRGSAKEFSSVTNIITFGLTEAATGEQLAGFQQRFTSIKLGMRAVFPEIHIRLSAYDKNVSMLQQGMRDAVRWIQQQLGDKVLSTKGKGMPAVVGDLLRKKKATIAVAESCTGGLIAHLLTNVSGSSDYFLFAGVTYANAAKTRVLGVSETSLQQYGAVHEKTARQMAEGVRRVSGAVYGLATTGIAGPSGGTAAKPVGTVCIGLAGADDAFGKRFYFSFENRDMNKTIFAVTALDLLRRKLMQPTR